MTTPQLDQGQTAGEATVESRAERDVLRELGFPVAPEAPDGAMEPSGPGPDAPARVDHAEAASSGDGTRGRRRRGRRRGASLRVRFTEDDRGAVTAEYALVIMKRHLAVTEILGRPESRLRAMLHYLHSVPTGAGPRRR